MPYVVMPGWLKHLLVPICSPMTHWPAFIMAYWKFRSCFSDYLSLMSLPLHSPLVLAFLPCQGEKRHLHLPHIPTLKQVVGLK